MCRSVNSPCTVSLVRNLTIRACFPGGTWSRLRPSRMSNKLNLNCGPKLTRERLEQFWSDPANWTFASIYRCREDPRIIVPRRPTACLRKYQGCPTRAEGLGRRRVSKAVQLGYSRSSTARSRSYNPEHLVEARSFCSAMVRVWRPFPVIAACRGYLG